MEMPQPQAEHTWLHQLIGEWTMEMECIMGPDQPPMKTSGRETVRSLGGLWTMGDGESEGMTAIMTLGYDPQQKRFVGTFVASCMTHLWIYNGSLDSTGKILTLNAEGPSFAGDGTLAQYQDIIEFVNADHRTLTSRVCDANGAWMQFMTAHYHRVK